eukprot:6182344-Pleurochrysis_carterae.AAC.2
MSFAMTARVVKREEVYVLCLLSNYPAGRGCRPCILRATREQVIAASLLTGVVLAKGKQSATNVYRASAAKIYFKAAMLSYMKAGARPEYHS